MSDFGRCFLPGPTDVRPEIYAATARTMFFHRGPQMLALLKEIQPALQEMFGTTRPVFTAASSATGMMETAIRNGVHDRVAVVTGGFFGEMFARVAEACGKEVVRIGVPYGQAITPEQLDQMLDGPEVDAIAMVHSESGTGALADLAALGPVIRKRKDLVWMVDAVTAAGATELQAEAWGVDFMFTGSQKALALPPGLALGVASERFVARAREVEGRGYYFYVLTFVEEAETGLFAHTVPIPLYVALQQQVRDIAATGGWAARWARHAEMLAALEAWVEGRPKMSLLAPPGRRSPAISAIRVGEEVDPLALVKELFGRGYQVGTGLGSLSKEIFRIGHMGDLTPDHLRALLAEVDSLLPVHA
ncbi:MAG: aminotransferase class V-fold PLP-dependent enzyme [Gemmatimonadales bacterium]|nr:aminotransferase class V-fold PLP-dependent enzyme [Gemmatimonadales bacterium]